MAMYRKTVHFIVAMLLTLLLGYCAALAASCTWVEQDVKGPPARHSPGMAYDSKRGVTVLFGGITGRRAGEMLFGDTWEWDGNSWKLVATTGPSPRLGHLMVYDEVRGVVVLFGGNDGTFRNETWEWDGSQWRLVYTGSGPTGRSRVGMAYDENRQKVVLFGGRLANGQPTGDTWEWDGSTWKQITGTGSQARARHGMVYYPALGTMISAGVAFGGGPETLILNGSQWEVVTGSGKAGRTRGSGPTSRVYYGMVYEAARKAVLLFSGWDGNKPLNDTWELRCE